MGLKSATIYAESDSSHSEPPAQYSIRATGNVYKSGSPASPYTVANPTYDSMMTLGFEQSYWDNVEDLTLDLIFTAGWECSSIAWTAIMGGQTGTESGTSMTLSAYDLYNYGYNGADIRVRLNDLHFAYYTVGYNANGGSGAPSSQRANVASGTVIGSFVIPSTIPVRADYTFMGWATSQSATVAQYQPGATVSNVTANMTLWAVWTLTTYATSVVVTKNNAAWTNCPYSYGLYQGGILKYTLTKGASNIYTANCLPGRYDIWLGNTDIGTDIYVTAGGTNSVTIAYYTITYNANGGSGTAPVDSNVYVSGSIATVAAPGSLYKSHYGFYCWNTRADGTGTTYLPTNSVTLSAPLTLYAIWAETSAVFVFDGTSWKAATTYNYMNSAWRGSQMCLYTGTWIT